MSVGSWFQAALYRRIGPDARNAIARGYRSIAARAQRISGSVKERIFPSGSFNQTTLAPDGAVQIPRESWSSAAYRSNMAPLSNNLPTVRSMEITDQPRTVKGCGRTLATFWI